MASQEDLSREDAKYFGRDPETVIVPSLFAGIADLKALLGDPETVIVPSLFAGTCGINACTGTAQADSPFCTECHTAIYGGAR